MDYNNNQQSPESQTPQQPQTPQAQVPPVQPPPPQAMPMQPPITPPTPQVPQGPPQRDDDYHPLYPQSYPQSQQQTYQPLEYLPPPKRQMNVGKIIGTIIAIGMVILGIYFVGTKTDLFSSSGKTYSKSGFSIKLPSEFIEKEILTQTAYFESPTAFVAALKEEFVALEEVGLKKIDTYTAAEYAKLVMQTGKIYSSISEIDGKLTTFEYSKHVSGKDITYFATVHKGSDAFWLVHFSCETKNFNKLRSKFIKWAKTIDID